MPGHKQKKAERGSQKWLQLLVNKKPELINSKILEKLNLPDTKQIIWLSPLKNDDYAEYSDNAFLEKLKIDSPKIKLEKFWPPRGAVWDGLAKAGDKYILVEAKAHINEIDTNPCGAGPESLAKIKSSLAETKTYLGSKSKADWSETFYQYTNRLAHLYFLKKLNNIDAHLLFVYFVNATDVDGPGSIKEWQGALKLLKAFLGIGRHKLSRHIHDIFIDVKDLEASA